MLGTISYFLFLRCLQHIPPQPPCSGVVHPSKRQFRRFCFGRFFRFGRCLAHALERQNNEDDTTDTDVGAATAAAASAAAVDRDGDVNINGSVNTNGGDGGGLVRISSFSLPSIDLRCSHVHCEGILFLFLLPNRYDGQSQKYIFPSR